MKSLTTELQQTLYTIGSSIYQGAEGATPPGGGDDMGGGTPPSDGGDDVIDAEFSEDK
jgi:molecular chaperone DnaK